MRLELGAHQRRLVVPGVEGLFCTSNQDTSEGPETMLRSLGSHPVG